MSEMTDQELDELLRRDFAVGVADEGFSERVMRALPPRQGQKAWLLPLATLTGGLLAWLALLPSPLLQQASREWLAGDIGPTSVAVYALLLGVGVLGCVWALEEAP